MKRYSANMVLTYSILIFMLCTSLFLLKDKWLLIKEREMQSYSPYLQSRLTLLENVHTDLNTICETKKEKIVKINLGETDYAFQCEDNNFFRYKEKLPKFGYLHLDELNDVINFDLYQDQFIQIDNLADLPTSSLDNPQLVILTDDVDDSLLNDFYGIMITPYSFNLKNRKRKNIKGMLISPNARDKQFVSYKKEVFTYLSQHYQHWNFVPNTKRVVNHQDEN